MSLGLGPLLQYQEPPPGSSKSTLPLIELVAVAIHRIAVLLYKANSPNRHSCIRMDRICSSTVRGKTSFHPTPFCLSQYSDPAQYPEGVTELPGYWAEDRIFAGVVLFGRGGIGERSVLKSYPFPRNKKFNEIPQCNDLWLHPSRKGVTRQICAVTEEKLGKLVQFLESENQGDQTACPLPILVDITYHRRVDNEIAIPEHNIYRDRWERRMSFRNFEDYEFVRGGTCFVDGVGFSGGIWEYFAHRDTAVQIGARSVDHPL